MATPAGMDVNRIIHGDALDVLRDLPDGAVDCVVCSPPYFGLRDYGVDGQIGLEPTPAEYVARMVAVFAEVRRVLADDGLCFINIGDSYANDEKWGGSTGGKHVDDLHGDSSIGRGRKTTGLPPKSLMMIPARLAIAMQDDCWILRSDIIWAKKNPLPESVRDRPTKAHEYVFMFAKQPRYWYDAEAISERAVMTGGGQFSDATHGARALNGHGPVKPRQDTDRRNARTVWHISTEPTPFAHFATMPTKLVRRCILAGCKPGGVVLDPFFGSGTTGLVARSVGRDWLGIELNGEYVALAEQRLSEMYTLPMFDRAASGED